MEMEDKVYTLKQQWLDAWNTQYPHWDVETLEIELRYCAMRIETYIELKYPTEVERLTLKSEYLSKLIAEKKINK